MHSKVICCKLYISESEEAEVVDKISRICREDPEVVLIKIFGDKYYKRVRYTLVSYIISDCSTGEVFSPIREVLFAMIKTAFSAINLEKHCGAHPRIGVVDDISFHPLGQAATMEDAAELAKLVACDIGNELKVPVFFYGAAHPKGKTASKVRHKLGYYEPNHEGNQWAGQVLHDPLQMKPDVGPTDVSRERGVTLVGAMHFVMGYNVPILCQDVEIARSIAGRVREQGGGLPSVLALGLPHGDHTEVACLLDPDCVGVDEVHSLVEQIAKEKGLKVNRGYSADRSKDEMLSMLAYSADQVPLTS